jgi:fumarylacetoacetase
MTATQASWMEIPEDSDFSLHNIPFSVFSLLPFKARPRCCTAIGSHVVDLSVLAEAGLFDDCAGFSPRVFSKDTLNDFMSYPRPVWVSVRNRLIDLFAQDGDERLFENRALQKACFHHLQDVTLCLPVDVPDYTDFYSSRDHATNVGIMFRGKDNALQPNWLHLPVGYHGRSSTILPSGTPVRRPCGQLQKDNDDPKQGSVYGPCKLLDFELEMAVLVGGPPNALGQPLTIDEANERIFGYCLMNDWSARDIQKWEYVPLGPFSAKNFLTTVSPWIVTTMALDDFRCPTSSQEQVDPKPLEYLQDPNYSSFDVTLQVAIQGDSMDHPEVVCESNLRNLYWNATQQLVHHSVTGCIMRPGDMLGSGTISGSTPSSFGSMLELCWKGTREVPLGDSGQVRKFLRDGDTVVMKGWADGKGGRVGFGVCAGKVLPSLQTGEKVEATVAIPLSGGDRYTDIKLYGYWKSSSTWRVRIALQAKSISYENIPVDLKQGAQNAQSHKEKNPMAQVPVLEYTDTVTQTTVHLAQSIAIVEFLEEAFPKRPALLPEDPVNRAKAREMVELINAGIQPLQNLPMVRRLEKMSEGKLDGPAWQREVIEKGLRALEDLVVLFKKSGGVGGPYALGGFAPSLVDACLVPQLYNARLFGVNLETCPTLVAIEQVCTKHPWFIPAHACVQPDAET